MKTTLHLISFLCLSLSPFYNFAQTIFSPENIIIDDTKTLDGPDDVSSADFDSDGDLDIVATSFSEGLIVWYQNLDGLGHFGEPQIISNQINDGHTVRTADIDNDGDMDIVSSGRRWFENIDGTGNFTVHFLPSGIGTSIFNVQTMEVADLDTDGDLDLVGVGYQSDNVFWFENTDGLGTFASRVMILTDFNQPTDVFPGDIDNDGDLDLMISGNEITDLVWVENEDGQGNFGAPKVIEETGSNVTHKQVHLADIDNDNDLDLFFTATFSGNTKWFRNLDGQGNFGPATVIDSLNTADGLTTFDMDNDNDLDLIVANTSEDNIIWYENDGSGTFISEHIITDVADGVENLFFADLDGDNDADLISCAFKDDDIAWHENLDGLGNYGPEQPLYDQTNGIRTLVAGDIDGDGDADFVAASELDSKISWFENTDGLGHFSAPSVVAATTGKATSTFLADFDGDMDLDIVATFSIDEKIVWYENLDGAGNFGGERIVATDILQVEDVFVADLDNDGDNDIVSFSVTPAEVIWYENQDGAGNFGAPQVVITEFVTMGRAILAADLDNDGDADLLTAAQLSHQIAWFENLGSGNFGEEISITTDAKFAMDVSVADIDGDGDMDVLSASLLDDKIAWYENLDGTNDFGSQQIISDQLLNPRTVVAFDADGDGDAEVFAGAEEDGKFVWFENLDGQSFGPEQLLSDDALGTRALFSVDIDNDGALDLLAGSFDIDKIVWFQNFLNFPSISGTCFFDENQNKIKDANEIGLLNHSISVVPATIANFTSREGEFRFFVDNNSYTVTAQPNENWVLTTDSVSYSISIQDSIIRDLLFGLAPAQTLTEFDPTLTSAATRCGFEVPFWLNYENSGTTYAGGLVACELDELTSLITADPMPDSTDNNTLFWLFDELAPSYSNTIRMRLQMPGVEFLGDTVAFNTSVFYRDTFGVLQAGGISEYPSVINCAYDPNDKLVTPEGVGNDGLTLFEEELEYTVRFQNTGTDTAFTVRIEDQLDTNLDWSSFQPIAASHNYEVNLYGTGLVEFIFKNILLPDSTTNEPASHGFIKYRILPLEGILENTAIQNTADIFFDFNPPIQTNTTTNTFVSVIVSSSTIHSDVKLDVFPNPTIDLVSFAIKNLPNTDQLTLSVRDTNGKRITSIRTSPDETITLSSLNWPAGIYFYEIFQDQQSLATGKLVKF